MSGARPNPKTSCKVRTEMSGNPKISVIMPNYDKGRFIGEAIESALKQTYRDFEVIVVDDASTDDSVTIVEGYLQKCNNVRLIRLEKQLGVSAARNIGIKSAQGEIICLLDSDDIYSPIKLERQFDALQEESEPVVVYSEWWRIDEEGRKLPPGKMEHPRKSGRIFGDVLALGFGVNTTFMIPKICLDHVGLYDESLPWSEDYDLILRLSRDFNFKHLDQELYGYRNYVGNTRNELKRKERLLYQSHVMEKHYKIGKQLLDRKTNNAVVASLIRFYSLTGQRKKVVRYGFTSFSALKSMFRSIVRDKPIK